MDLDDDDNDSELLPERRVRDLLPLDILDRLENIYTELSQPQATDKESSLEANRRAS